MNLLDKKLDDWVRDLAHNWAGIEMQFTLRSVTHINYWPNHDRLILPIWGERGGGFHLSCKDQIESAIRGSLAKGSPEERVEEQMENSLPYAAHFPGVWRLERGIPYRR